MPSFIRPDYIESARQQYARIEQLKETQKTIKALDRDLKKLRWKSKKGGRR